MSTNTKKKEETPEIEVTPIETAEVQYIEADQLATLEATLKETDPTSEEFGDLYLKYLTVKADIEETQNPTILTRVKHSKPIQFIARHKKAAVATGAGLGILGIFALASRSSNEDEEEDLEETDTTEDSEV